MEEALTALLAPIAGGHRYWVRKPQAVDVLPYVVLQRISHVRGYHMQGDDSLPENRVQVDVYAETFTSARNTAKAIVDLVTGYRSEAIRGIFVDGQRDLPTSDAGEVNHLFRTSIDLIVWHRETVE